MRLVLHVITHFLWGLEICRLIKDILMHQSIPAVPIPPPRATLWLTLSVPGVVHSAFVILSPPRGLCISIPRGDSRAFDTCFGKTDIGKEGAFAKDWHVHQGLEKLVHVFKGMFSQF